MRLSGILLLLALSTAAAITDKEAHYKRHARKCLELPYLSFLADDTCYVVSTRGSLRACQDLLAHHSDRSHVEYMQYDKLPKSAQTKAGLLGIEQQASFCTLKLGLSCGAGQSRMGHNCFRLAQNQLAQTSQGAMQQCHRLGMNVPVVHSDGDIKTVIHAMLFFQITKECSVFIGTQFDRAMMNVDGSQPDHFRFMDQKQLADKQLLSLSGFSSKRGYNCVQATHKPSLCGSPSRHTFEPEPKTTTPAPTTTTSTRTTTTPKRTTTTPAPMPLGKRCAGYPLNRNLRVPYANTFSPKSGQSLVIHGQFKAGAKKVVVNVETCLANVVPTSHLRLEVNLETKKVQLFVKNYLVKTFESPFKFQLYSIRVRFHNNAIDIVGDGKRLCTHRMQAGYMRMLNEFTISGDTTLQDAYLGGQYTRRHPTFKENEVYHINMNHGAGLKLGQKVRMHYFAPPNNDTQFYKDSYPFTYQINLKKERAPAAAISVRPDTNKIYGEFHFKVTGQSGLILMNTWGRDENGEGWLPNPVARWFQPFRYDTETDMVWENTREGIKFSINDFSSIIEGVYKHGRTVANPLTGGYKRVTEFAELDFF